MRGGGTGPLRTAPARAEPGAVRTWAPEHNPFRTVVADVTHRCNMACANCYIPNRDVPDMDIGRLESCLAAFPRRTDIRIIGAEPTMRRDLPEIVATVRRLGHRPILLTNGLRLATESYVRTLREAGLRHVCISFNGADNDDWYAAIDNMRCARKKMQAVRHSVALGMIVNTGTILVRGVNEDAVCRVLAFVRGLGPRHAILRFKNIGAFGRYDDEAAVRNLSMGEIEALSAEAIGVNIHEIAARNRIGGPDAQDSRLFPADPDARFGHGIWFKLTDWQANALGRVDPDTRRRGRITEDFRIAPAVDHMKANEGGY